MSDIENDSSTVEPGEGRQHLGVLLRSCWYAFLDELFAGLAAEGFDDVRPAHSPVFQHLERGGTRIGVLAERAQMTNQSMGYLVDALERRGYVERTPDPADRRAALVVITNRGRQQITTARRLIADIEREWEQRIGAQRMAALHDALQTLATSHESDAKSRRERPAPRTAASA